MRIPRTAIGLALAGAAILVLSGCVQATPHVIPTSASTTTPVFASDASALAAAKKAYAGYLAASDAVDHDGGIDAERLSQWETPDQYARDTASIARFRREGHHTAGSSSYRDARLQSSTIASDGGADVSVYVCLDISKTTLFDDKQNDIGTGRPLVLPLIVDFVSSKSDRKSLIINRSNSWSGANFCG